MTSDAPARKKSHSALESALEEKVHSTSTEELREVAAHPKLTEELALALLARRDIPQNVLEDLSKNGHVMKHRPVILGVVGHPRTPRHVSIPIARHLYTFELMQLALTPSIAADVKMQVEEAIILRLESISAGERLTLAKRGSTRVAAALLADPEERVILAALANPRLTEAWIVKAIMRDDAQRAFIEAACRDKKWSLRRDIRIALVRNAQTPLEYVAAFVHALPTQVLRDIQTHARLHATARMFLLDELHKRDERKT